MLCGLGATGLPLPPLVSELNLPALPAAVSRTVNSLLSTLYLLVKRDVEQRFVVPGESSELAAARRIARGSSAWTDQFNTDTKALAREIGPANMTMFVPALAQALSVWIGGAEWRETLYFYYEKALRSLNMALYAAKSTLTSSLRTSTPAPMTFAKMGTRYPLTSPAAPPTQPYAETTAPPAPYDPGLTPPLDETVYYMGEGTAAGSSNMALILGLGIVVAAAVYFVATR